MATRRATSAKSKVKTALVTKAAAAGAPELPVEAPRDPEAAPAPALCLVQPATVRDAIPPMSLEERRRRIEVAAYLIAEREGFSTDPAHNWIAAEREVEAAGDCA